MPGLASKARPSATPAADKRADRAAAGAAAQSRISRLVAMNTAAVAQRACGCSGSDGTREQELMRSAGVQPRLEVSTPDDPFELEADRVADQVMRMADRESVAPEISSADTAISRKCSSCAAAEETGDFSSVVARATSGTGHPLDNRTRDFMESRFAHDFSGVRIHTGADAAASARSINALAYTVGNNIVFGAGRYDPNSGSGQRLLAHELTHSIQQGHAVQRLAGVGPTTEMTESTDEVRIDRQDDPNAGAGGSGGAGGAGSGGATDSGGGSDTDQTAAPGAPPTPDYLDPNAPEPFPGAKALVVRSRELDGEVAQAIATYADAYVNQDLPWDDIIQLKKNIATARREKLLIDTFFANGYKDGKLDDDVDKVIELARNAAPDETRTLELVEGHGAPPGKVSEVVKDLLLTQADLFPDHVIGLYRSAVEEFTRMRDENGANAAAMADALAARPIETIIPDFIWIMKNDQELDRAAADMAYQYVTLLDLEEPVMLEKKDPNSTKLGIDDIRLRVNEMRVDFSIFFIPPLSDQLSFLYPVLQSYYLWAAYDALASQMNLFLVTTQATYERLNQPLTSPDVLIDLNRAYTGGSPQVSFDKMREGYHWVSSKMEDRLDKWVTSLPSYMRVWEGFGLYDIAGEMKTALKAMVTPKALLIMAGFVAFFIALQFVPFGNLIADAVVIAMLGHDVLEVFGIFAYYYDRASDAPSFRALYRDAQDLEGGGAALVGLLTQLVTMAIGGALGKFAKYVRGKKIKSVDELAGDPVIKEGPPEVRSAFAEARAWTARLLKLPASVIADLTAEAIARLQKLASWMLERMGEMTEAALRKLLGCASPCKVDIAEIEAYFKEMANKKGAIGKELNTVDDILEALPKDMNTTKIASQLRSKPALMVLFKEAKLTDLDLGKLGDFVTKADSANPNSAYQTFTKYLTQMLPSKIGPDVERLNAIAKEMVEADPRQGSALKGPIFEAFVRQHVSEFAAKNFQRATFKFETPDGVRSRTVDRFYPESGEIWQMKHQLNEVVKPDEVSDYQAMIGKTSSDGVVAKSANYLFATKDAAELNQGLAARGLGVYYIEAPATLVKLY